jgi:predicted XRE-type DNA-binding protein
MHSKIETITPKRANELLADKHKNRPLKAQAIDQFAADMKAGRWEMNGQPIIISDEGRLSDGQNRMAAIVQSGVTIDLLVVYGVPAERMATMDTGTKRSVADVLGMRDVPNATLVGSIARTAYAFISGMTIYQSPSKTAVVDFVSKHPHVETVAAYTKRVNAAPQSAFGAVIFLATESRRLDKEAHEFVEQVQTGLNLKADDPAYALRLWVEVRSRNRDHRITAEAMFGATCRAWNAFALGEPLRNIRSLGPVYRETFRIVGLDFDLFADVPRLQHRKTGDVEAPRVRTMKIDATLMNRIYHLEQEGLTQREIAIDVNLGKQTVQRLLAKMRDLRTAEADLRQSRG